jgi:hypothetical protein
MQTKQVGAEDSQHSGRTAARLLAVRSGDDTCFKKLTIDNMLKLRTDYDKALFTTTWKRIRACRLSSSSSVGIR